MERNRDLVAIALALMVSGCAANVRPPATFRPSAGEALIFGRLTTEGCTAASTYVGTIRAACSESGTVAFQLADETAAAEKVSRTSYTQAGTLRTSLAHPP